MSRAECERWIALADQSATGECLADRDQAFLAQHASSCSECHAEREFYHSLQSALGRPELLVVPSSATATPMHRRWSRRPVAIGLALAAGIAAVVIGHGVLRSGRPTASVQATAPSAQVLFASGDAHMGLGRAEAGQSIVQGERLSTGVGLACLGVASSIEVCLDGDSAAIFALGDAHQILVYLEKGSLMARLDHQPVGRKFFVRTTSAEMQAVGTRFSVHRTDDGSTSVRLHEGRLAVRGASRVSTDLLAPSEAKIAQDILVAPISGAATEKDKLLTDLVEVARLTRGASLMLTSTPAGANVALDDVAMGKTPLSMFVEKGVHVRLSLPGYQPVSDWIACESCGEGQAPSRIERTFNLTALEAVPSEVPDKPSRAKRTVLAVSPDRLLAKAQSLRADGKYEACAQLYRRLSSEFPRSEEAKVSMISLGELELVHTKNAASALEAFNAYLRIGGPLEREARFGKIRALRSLDRRAESDAEATRFLRDYPTGVQAATLRRELHGR
jgi:ferric-dicitrate binding protein FerR (iron transport regulator)